MAIEIVVTDLFPLSKEAVNGAFLTLNPSISNEEYSMLRNDSFETLQSKPGLRGLLLFERYKSFSEACGVEGNVLKESLYQYGTGLALAHEMLTVEALIRGGDERDGETVGVLPNIHLSVLKTWLRDDTSQIKAEIYQLGELLTDVETETDLKLLQAVDKQNKYGNGRLNYFMRTEPELSRAYEIYLPVENGNFRKYHHMTRGIFHLCSLIKAYGDTMRLNQQFGSDSSTQ